MATRPTVLVLGGGYVGLFTSLTLQRRLRRDEARIVVVDPRSYMTYQPFLPEAAAGSLEPRHVVVPLRRMLKHCEVVTGRVTGLDHDARTARIQPVDGQPYDVGYDHVVVALGSVARTLPIPGLLEVGIGFKQVEEAIALRNHVLTQLDAAESTHDPAERRKVLSFVVVGAGYAGIEALAELEDMSRDACRYYERVSPEDLRWVLVEATHRVLPEVGEQMGGYTLEQLRSRNIEIHLGTRLESCVDHHVVLSDGTEFDAETLIWTAGVKANPALTTLGLPLDDKGRLRCRADLRVEGDDGVVEGAWGAGDCAAVPDLTKGPGAYCGPSAQHAVRQARRLGANIVAVLRGREPAQYRHAYLGSVASLGLHKGVAEIKGIKVKGFPAWFMHRTYHVSQVPTVNRKVRVIMDWTLALFFRREIISLGDMHDPFHEFRRAAAPVPQSVPQPQR